MRTVPSWFREALACPADEGDVVVAGTRIRYRAWGRKGRPGIVFVHGGAAHARWWDHVAPQFAGEHRVVALDLSGHGDSDHAERYSHESWAEQVRHVAGDAGIAGRPILVGHSMGGLVSLRAALSFGERLAGVVCVDSAVRDVTNEEMFIRRQRALRQPRLYPTREAAMARFHPIPEVGRALQYVVDHLAETSVRETEAGWTWKFDPGLFGQSSLTPAQLFPPRCEVAFIRAEHGLPSAAAVRLMHERVGSSLPVIEIADSGHHVMLDQPLPLVAALRSVFERWDAPVALKNDAFAKEASAREGSAREEGRMSGGNGAADFDLPARLRAVLAVDPTAPALELDGRWHTWGDLSATAGAVETHLRRAGAPEGAKVGVVMRNRPGVVGAVTGALMSRRGIVSLSHLQPAAALARDVATLDLVAVVADEEDWADEGLRAAARAAGVLGLSVRSDDPRQVEVVTECSLTPAEIGARAQPGVAVSMLTSGTTGPPKRVPVGFRNLEASFAGAAHYESGRPWQARLRSGVAILVAPLLHTSGLFRLLLNLLDGRAVAMLEKFTVDGLVRLVSAYDAHVLALTPASLAMILDADVAPEVFTHVRVVVCGTAPLSPDMAERFEERYDVAVLVVYGATEFAGGIAGWTLKDRQEFREAKRGSVGRVHPGVEVRVRHQESGELLPPGEVGRLDVRSAQSGAEPGTWQETTDLARVDGDGFVWVVGRTDDVIIRGGFKISTGMVAEVVKEHPSVRDAAVVGLPDRRLGEVPVAAVEVARGAALDPESLTAWVRGRLPAYQVPTAFVVVDALPRTPSLKVSQDRLKALLAAELGGA
ncbi:alpha/beta fold hydrolase [Nonomuraea cavernae]|uniref:Alpha/beta fold hydrolase n=1 Tax=Nonomuraea cavernae TaxID=2045107 RepID=A0A918DM72_9ACTN|nr:alpha/beta fold hydrolase [Nonomuraea cavernae]MCA2188056.1 alpha/beta fold hydrolase [Nonomuraea cavernae]GGO72683.1 hypothetical protein GCM10012289_41250 [Nonomuraea cavernae]